MRELIDRQLGPYRILELIGRGGMAAIYKAYQPATDRLVAIKVLLGHRAEDPQTVQRFEHEVRVITGLEHSNIVPVYDFGREGDLLYLVMRYMRAGTVNDLLKRGALTAGDAASILTDIASALDYAHGRDIIHRDIKPNNILVDAGGRANLTDFGLAKVLTESFDLTHSGTAIGTPAYMAPEQVSGGPISPRTDVYALGVMLYEMVTGVLPFVSDSPMAVAMMHLREEMRPARQVNPLISPLVEIVINRAMTKEPDARFSTAGEMAAALTQAVSVMGRSTIIGQDISDRSEQATIVPTASTLHLAELAAAVAETKSPDEITPEIRRALKRRERESRFRPLLAFIPWVIAGLLIVTLVITLVRGSVDSRTSTAGTATAVQALILQLSEAQTAIAAGGGPNAQSTLAQLQTQIAAASTIESTPTPARVTSTLAQATATSGQEQPTSVQVTSTPRPGLTSVPTIQPSMPPATEPPEPTSIIPPVLDTLLPNIIPSLPNLLP